MNSIRLKPIYSNDKLPVGSSKFFGNPDVWEGFEWPSIEIDGELYDLTSVSYTHLTLPTKA